MFKSVYVCGSQVVVCAELLRSLRWSTFALDLHERHARDPPLKKSP